MNEGTDELKDLQVWYFKQKAMLWQGLSDYPEGQVLTMLRWLSGGKEPLDANIFCLQIALQTFQERARKRHPTPSEGTY